MGKAFVDLLDFGPCNSSANSLTCILITNLVIIFQQYPLHHFPASKSPTIKLSTPCWRKLCRTLREKRYLYVVGTTDGDFHVMVAALIFKYKNKSACVRQFVLMPGKVSHTVSDIKTLNVYQCLSIDTKK